jgi:hypothetical protein
MRGARWPPPRACSFARAKKCSNEGRALMQLDYKQFLSKVEPLSAVK